MTENVELWRMKTELALHTAHTDRTTCGRAGPNTTLVLSISRSDGFD